MSAPRGAYFPGTEPLGADEMRITALGTGRPFLRLAQSNACWLVELGNGDVFMFDFGFGSQKNFSAMEIPYDRVTAFFATHLHTDHVGDFAQIWIGSWVDGRLRPLVVYGPSGPKPRYGMRHFVERQKEAYAWDTDTRVGVLPAVGAEVEVTEFDYAKPGIVYQRNGVTISSAPAVHIYDGPVSYRLDWNGLSFVYSGDTTPNRFLLEQAKGCDVLVHDTYNTVSQMMTRQGEPERSARIIVGWVHSDPAEAAKVFEAVQPRLAVGFHFYNDFDTVSEMEAEIRKHYRGRLALSQDFMVFNVTRDAIRERMAVVNGHGWPRSRNSEGFAKARRGERLEMSPFLREAELFPKALGAPPPKR